jgi:hypothetical protein
LFRIRYWAYLRWLFHGEFNDQDARVVEMMSTPPEQLFRPDISIVEWRKLYEKAVARNAGPLGVAQSDVESPAAQSQLNRGI